jgi:hypothetical protein
MNEWDRDNLRFLLTSDKATLDEWYAQCDADDIAYALELMKAYKSELMLKEFEYIDELAEEDLSAANKLLSKIAKT